MKGESKGKREVAEKENEGISDFSPLSFSSFHKYFLKGISVSCSGVSDSESPWTQKEPARLLCPWNFPGKKYQNGLSFPSSGDFPNPGIEPVSLASSAMRVRFSFFFFFLNS